MKNAATTEREDEPKKSAEMDAGLHDLFLDELAGILDAERQSTKVLPKMAKAAESDELREAFESHLKETKTHITRLQDVFKTLGESPQEKKCKAMAGLLEEGEDLMEEMKDSPALDAALIAAAQKVEHHEIASYGTVIAWAAQMGHERERVLLADTLAEEEAADEKLAGLAEDVAG